MTREVKVGCVGVGAHNPIRIQSMTTTPTHDVKATVEQILKLVEHGCEIVRMTVQGKKEAYACEKIKNALLQKNCHVPLAADIHFYPPAAMVVTDFVDKVRINPGNFADPRAQFKSIEYTDAIYQRELEKIEEKFAPLILKLKQQKKALRIGTNHGSLSDRIMNFYGDTVEGMIESALEYARIARKLDFHDMIFSMKASNPIVMVEAYRKLHETFQKMGWDYPLHLGVTEAGEGEDGRVKSAVGIGTLLLDGIGDTIRVSLTEDPEKEMEPCRQIVNSTKEKNQSKYLKGDKKRAIAIVKVSLEDLEKDDFYETIGCEVKLSRPERGPRTVDGVYSGIDHPKLDKLEEIGVEVIRDKEAFTPCDIDHIRAQAIKRQLIISQDDEIKAGCKLGSLLLDNLIDGILLDTSQSLKNRYDLTFSILQACRKKAIKTEFISCPSCGRTLFDLQQVTRRIKAKTAHLPGVKIAIMGCIVNGPGEMADADFGYVGSRPGKIDLYVGKECVEKNIDFADADDRLIELIKKHGMWKEVEEFVEIR